MYRMRRYKEYKSKGFELYIDLATIVAMRRDTLGPYSIELSGGNRVDIPWTEVFNEIKTDWQAYIWNYHA